MPESPQRVRASLAPIACTAQCSLLSCVWWGRRVTCSQHRTHAASAQLRTLYRTAPPRFTSLQGPCMAPTTATATATATTTASHPGLLRGDAPAGSALHIECRRGRPPCTAVEAAVVHRPRLAARSSLSIWQALHARSAPSAAGLMQISDVHSAPPTGPAPIETLCTASCALRVTAQLHCSTLPRRLLPPLH